MDDPAIVELYWQRSDRAIPETAAKYGNYCRSIACNILQNPQDAEECLNDTWLRAWNAMPDQRPAQLKPFLGRLTRWVSLDRRRHENRDRRGGGDDSFFDMLDFFKDHELWPGWEPRSLDEMLELSGMSAGEAKAWYTGYSWENENHALLHAGVIDAAGLYQEDLLLGMYGGEARVVAEGSRGRYEMLEIQVDYTEFYRQLAEERGFAPPESELIKDYLLLFEPEEQYLIFVGGSAPDFPFETLEKIADNMELKVTDFPTKPLNERQSYVILDLGRG